MHTVYLATKEICTNAEKNGLQKYLVPKVTCSLFWEVRGNLHLNKSQNQNTESLLWARQYTKLQLEINERNVQVPKLEIKLIAVVQKRKDESERHYEALKGHNDIIYGK